MRYRAVLIDLSGTLHIDGKAIPGAIEGLERLRQAKIPCRFVTNTTKDSIGSLLNTLTGLGFDIHKEEVFSSLTATMNLLKERSLRPLLLLHPRALPDFQGIAQEDPNAVVVGLAREAFSYDNLNRAFRLLHAKPDAPLIAIHRGRVFAEHDGLSMGPGPFVAALEVASQRRAEVVGKPSPKFFEGALKGLGLGSPSEAVMIGDDVNDDVRGAMAIGMGGILVRTGKYRTGDESSPPGPAPDAVVDDFAAAVDWILEQNSRRGVK